MKYKDVIKKMTLEEKASLLSGENFWESRTIKRLNIPPISMADGPSGIRRQVDNVDHLGLHAGKPATCFPSASTLSNSWNEELEEEVGRCLGEEAVALQVSVLLGPGLNIKRSPLCGRNFEYFSEDPYLSGKMAAACIKGIQSQGISACPKHFAVNNQEHLRMSNDSVVDERTLREIYLTGFEIAVKEGKPRSIMSSYNRINGTYANENFHLLREILVDEWQFDGFVVSDWGGSNDHLSGVIAGSHLEMPSTKGNSVRELVDAVKSKKLPVKVLNERVDELLNVVFSIKNLNQLKGGKIDGEAHHNIAQKAAEESVVLLKNEDNILPIAPNTKVAVIGDFADTPRYQGAGSSMVNPIKMDTTLSFIKSGNLDMIGYEQGFERMGERNDALKEAACDLAKKAEVVLLYLGLDEIIESEGLDREHMCLRQNQISLLKAINKVNSNIVVVLSCGSSLEMPWIEKCKGLLHGSLGGQAGAVATLNIITGKVCPSGKLSETYPMDYYDNPTAKYFPGKEATSEYREGLFVGYRYYNTAKVNVRFPFGYGLSYTSFNYSDIEVTPLGVIFTLTNTGKYDGAEISQLYIGLKSGEVFRPEKELKGFKKTFLKAGESKRISILFDDKTFRYFNVDTNKFEIEGGNYQIYIGASVEDIRLQAVLGVKGSDAKSPYNKECMSNYYSGDIKDVSDKMFETLLGKKIPQKNWNKRIPLDYNDTLSQLEYAKGFVARMVFKVFKFLKKRAEKSGKPNLNILFLYNVTFRGMAKMANGALDMNMVGSILEIVNGRFFLGLIHLVKGWFRMKRENKRLMHKLENANKGSDNDA